MPIVARDLDVSEKKTVFQWSNMLGGQSAIVANGGIMGVSTLINMFMMPFPCTIQTGTVFSQGLSGAPQISLKTVRWAPGATTFDIGISNMVLTTFGTSGFQGLSGLPAAGSTLLNLQYGDVVQLVTSGANTAISQLIVELVVKRTQDIVAYNNVST
jgi:hypothetical protein